MPAPDRLLPYAAVAAALLTAALAAWGAVRVRGSTAVPAAVWSVVACLALAADLAGHATGRLDDPAAAAAVRLAVVSLSLCPTMSLLGAKRPQHGPWQFIVATLACVLFLPAASAWLTRPGSLPDLHAIERFFMPALVALGWLNFAGTRRAVAVGCVAIGQLLLARGFLPGVATDAVDFGGRLDVVAAGLVAGGAVIAALASAGPRPRGESGRGVDAVAAAVNPPYLALRETLGAAWALRLAEAFDALAKSRGWPCRLRFGGIAAEGAADAAWHRDALHAFRALARRFVDDAWLSRHGWPSAAELDRHEAPPPRHVSSRTS
jgi:hypothetical protein